MLRCTTWVLLLLLVGCGDFSDSESDPDPSGDLDSLVTVTDGRLQGVVNDSYDVVQFLGVPYAEPPLGDLRWGEPQAAEPWLNVRDATAVESACIQGVLNPSGGGDGSEDCLYLNVVAPESAPERLRPVLIWLHGVDNDSGSGSLAPVDTDAMAALAEATDTVVVSINARLGFLGFLALPELVAESANATTGNYHHLDQVLALQWVRDNILVFNGDPLNVTLMGQAAGANDVCLHLSSSLTTGLFQRAILQSSSCLSNALAPLAERLAQGIEFAALWGCEADLDRLDCLRQQEPTVMRDALFLAGKHSETFAVNAVTTEVFSSVAAIDLYAFEGPIDSILGAGTSTAVPVLLGVNRNEYTLYRQDASLQQPSGLAGYTAAIQAYLPQYDNSADLFTLTSVLYPVSSYDSYADAFADLMGDAVYTCPGIQMANTLSDAGRLVYFYEFTRAVDDRLLLLRDIGDPGEDAPGLGVAQSAELSYLWDDRALQSGDSPELTVGVMQDYWSAFARNGAPDAPDQLDWPGYDALNGRYQEIGEEVSSQLRLKATPCAFFNGS